MTHAFYRPEHIASPRRSFAYAHTLLTAAAVMTAAITATTTQARAQAPQSPADSASRADTTDTRLAAGRTASGAPTPSDGARADGSRSAQPRLPSPAGHRHLDASVALRASTLGAGIEVDKLITDHLAVRAGYFHTPFSLNRTVSGVQYAAQAQLQGATLLADLFPWPRGAFHLTAGAVLNGPRITASAVPGSDGTVTLNNHPYSQAELGQLSGKLSVRSAAPYLGLGFGTPARKSAVSFITDIGVMFGAPTLSLDATGAAQNAQLRSDLAAQQARTQADINRYGRLIPVLSSGIAVRF